MAAAPDLLAARPCAPRRAALLTVDVEDWFDVNYRSWTPPAGFAPARRVLPATRLVLDALAAAGRRGTFFVLGEAARAEPELVPAIAAGGHEIACHGLTHRLLYASDPATVRRELADARRLLEDQSGGAVLGFRAPSWSIVRDALWVLDVVAETGFRYDASLFPFRTYLYGLAEAPLRPAWLTTPGGRTLLEIPAPVARVGPLRVPHGGGFYLRMLPVAVERLLQARRLRHGDPALLYLHPRELDPHRTTLPLGLAERMIQDLGVGRAGRKLRRLLAALPWEPIRTAYAAELAAGAPV